MGRNESMTRTGTIMIERMLSHIGDMLVFAITSVIFGLIKTLMAPEPGTWKHQIACVFLSTLIGTLAGGLAMQMHLGDYTSLICCSIASLLSRDIVMAILNNRQALGALLRMALINLVNRLKGGM